MRRAILTLCCTAAMPGKQQSDGHDREGPRIYMYPEIVYLCSKVALLIEYASGEVHHGTSEGQPCV